MKAFNTQIKGLYLTYGHIRSFSVGWVLWRAIDRYSVPHDYMKDEGAALGIGIQEQTSKHFTCCGKKPR